MSSEGQRQEVMNAVRDERLLDEQIEDVTGKKTKKYLDMDSNTPSPRPKEAKTSTNASPVAPVQQAALNGN